MANAQVLPEPKVGAGNSEVTNSGRLVSHPEAEAPRDPVSRRDDLVPDRHRPLRRRLARPIRPHGRGELRYPSRAKRGNPSPRGVPGCGRDLRLHELASPLTPPERATASSLPGKQTNRLRAEGVGRARGTSCRGSHLRYAAGAVRRGPDLLSRLWGESIPKRWYVRKDIQRED